MAHAYTIFVGCVALARLGELVLSRRNRARVAKTRAGASTAEPTRISTSAELPPAELPPAEGRGGYAAMVAVHVALLVAPVVEHEWARREPHPAIVVAAAIVFGAAQVLRVLAIRALGARWNVRAVVSPAAGLVEHGPYRHVRHPNYTAVLLEFLSLPMLGGAWVSWIVLNLVHAPILARRVRAEERALRHVPGWAERMEPKPRYLPRLFARRTSARGENPS